MFELNMCAVCVCVCECTCVCVCGREREVCERSKDVITLTSPKLCVRVVCVRHPTELEVIKLMLHVNFVHACVRVCVWR